MDLQAFRARVEQFIREHELILGRGDITVLVSGGPDSTCLWHVLTELGYSAEDSTIAPEAANLGLGCGNPLAIASLKQGETVLDLGSGAGFDCFLAARAVGPTGKVIGVDMTPDMLAKARANAKRNGFNNVEFRLGEIEALPLADESVASSSPTA